jgi:hypothetical protein
VNRRAIIGILRLAGKSRCRSPTKEIPNDAKSFELFNRSDASRRLPLTALFTAPQSSINVASGFLPEFRALFLHTLIEMIHHLQIIHSE